MSAPRFATDDHFTPHKEDTMEPRLNFYKSSPAAMKAMAGLEQHVAQSGLEKPLVELVRLRASQINGCAYCMDVHSTDARKAGETERRLATLAVWRETPFFSDRERAAFRKLPA
jgi:AhpD family alkylhydroperoxidase